MSVGKAWYNMLTVLKILCPARGTLGKGAAEGGVYAVAGLAGGAVDLLRLSMGCQGSATANDQGQRIRRRFSQYQHDSNREKEGIGLVPVVITG